LKILDFLYYRLYRMFLKTSAKNVAEYVACIWLAALLGLNLIVIIGSTGVNPLNYMYPKVFGLLILTPLFILFYFRYLRNSRYLKIVERYKNETKRQRIIGNLIMIAYIVATFAALLFPKK